MTMRHIRNGFTIAGISFLFFLMSGCAHYSKDNYLADFTDFISTVEAEYKDYSESNWVERDAEYQSFIGEYYEQYREKLTSEDQRAIGKLKAKYQTIKVKDSADRMIDKVGDGLKQLEGIIEGVTETISNP